MPGNWDYRELQDEVQGRGIAEDNFAPELRTGCEILVREVIQNSLDARISNDTPVKVVMRKLSPDSIDTGYLRRLLPSDYISRLETSGDSKWDSRYEQSGVLLIEDFNTIGLPGTFNDSRNDGPRENWNAFWFREGEGAKGKAGSNGRAGQGKITLYRMTKARAIFAYTVREDGKHLLMGRSSFSRTYWLGSEKYSRDAFWCHDLPYADKKKVLPIEDAQQISAFRSALRLQRESEPGLSIVIPYPVDFDSRSTLATLISEFYFPIISGRLVVVLDDQELSATNIDVIAEREFPDSKARELRSPFTSGYRAFVREIVNKHLNPTIVVRDGWESTTSLAESVFDSSVLAELRKAADEGKCLALRFPLKIKHRQNGPQSTWVDVFLQIPPSLTTSEEAYVRRDLLIGSEIHLSGMTHLPRARGLTLISHDVLSAFLADAEEPTHLKWNASRPRLAEEYVAAEKGVRAVRLAMPRLLALIVSGTVKRDSRVLAKYFTKPADLSSGTTSQRDKGAGGGKSDHDHGKNDDKVPKIQSRLRPLKLATTGQIVNVLPNGAQTLQQVTLPLHCRLEIAYEGLDADPFREYDPFDFDLVDEKIHSVVCSGALVTERRANFIDFEIHDPAFGLTVGGFDPNIRLRARLTYKESSDGETVDTQQSDKSEGN